MYIVTQNSNKDTAPSGANLLPLLLLYYILKLGSREKSKFIGYIDNITR